MREPTLAWWPGRIPAGKSCDTVAGTIDLLPTCVALAGGILPATPVIDGKDISSLLFEASNTSPREAHYYFDGYNLQSVRQGAWKLAMKPQSEGMGEKTEADASGKEPRLYNLDEDISERSDVASKHPEIVKRLLALAQKMEGEIGGTNPAARRPAGEVVEPKPLYPMEEKAKGKADKAR